VRGSFRRRKNAARARLRHAASQKSQRTSSLDGSTRLIAFEKVNLLGKIILVASLDAAHLPGEP